MARIRIDLALVQGGLAASREQARRLVMAGEVMVGDEVITKPGWLIRPDAALRVKQLPKYVSRGGLKLEGALEHFQIDVAGMTCLDVGAST
ncbi:MAG: TlyA family rRNA (cytidine-2'-O)-methyltransferase, partial [Prosthecobacter sp.]|nr:TlyA family rRNA (cytidine-2'-O)-methyltransferase [Prosthecobacter sp.]